MVPTARALMVEVGVVPNELASPAPFGPERPVAGLAGHRTPAREECVWIAMMPGAGDGFGPSGRRVSGWAARIPGATEVRAGGFLVRTS